MSGMPLETCWAFNERWNNKFCYKVASCWLFLLRSVILCYTDCIIFCSCSTVISNEINCKLLAPPLKQSAHFQYWLASTLNMQDAYSNKTWQLPTWLERHNPKHHTPNIFVFVNCHIPHKYLWSTNSLNSDCYYIFILLLFFLNSSAHFVPVLLHGSSEHNYPLSLPVFNR